MNPSSPHSDANRRLGWGLIGMMIGLYVLDQVSKFLIVLNFYPPSQTPEQHLLWRLMSEKPLETVIPVIDGFFNIVRVHNTGVAFGFGNGSAWSVYVFLAIPVIAIIALILLYRKGFFHTKWMRVGWALLLTGVCGNLTDRLVQGFVMDAQWPIKRDFWETLKGGYVVDFVDIKVPLIDWHWPAFNVADSCICIAAVIFLICSFRADSAGNPSQTKS